MTKLKSSSSDLCFNQPSTLGLPCSSQHCPILVRVLLSWFSQNPPSSVSDHLQCLIHQVMCDHSSPPFSNNPVSSVQPELLLSLRLPLSTFHLLTPSLLLGYKSPLFLVVFRVDSNLSPPLQNSIVVVLIPISQLFPEQSLPYCSLTVS